MQGSDDEFIKVLIEDEASDHCDQIEMFYDEAEQLLGSLSSILPKGEDVVSYGREHGDEAKNLPPEEPLGYLAVYPSQNAGVSMVIFCDPKTKKNRVKAVFPFIGEGNKYPCAITNVSLYPNRLEANISAFVDEEQNLMLNFYDAHYMDNRVFYNNEDTFQFIIRGLAYCLETNHDNDPDELKKIAGIEESGSNKELKIDANSLIAVYPREDIGKDHYEIQAPVSEINEYGEVNGEKVWQLEVPLGNTSSGDEIPLCIYVTERCLNGSPLPAVGDSISTVVWLQGHLWGIGEMEEGK